MQILGQPCEFQVTANVTDQDLSGLDGAGGGAEGDDGHCCLVLQLLLLLLLLVLPRRAAAASITRASNVGIFFKDDTGNSPNLGVNAFARVKKL